MEISYVCALGCERTESDNACVRACDKLSFRKINGNRRKCTHWTLACARCFQATSDKILNFYDFTLALLRQIVMGYVEVFKINAFSCLNMYVYIMYVLYF